MGQFGEYDESPRKQTKEEKDRTDESWDVFNGPGLSPFTCTMAATIFNEEFSHAITERNLEMIILIPFSTWFLFFVFRAIVISAFSVTIAGSPWFEKLGKWKGRIATLFTILCFAASYWVIHYVLK